MSDPSPLRITSPILFAPLGDLNDDEEVPPRIASTNLDSTYWRRQEFIDTACEETGLGSLNHDICLRRFMFSSTPS